MANVLKWTRAIVTLVMVELLVNLLLALARETIHCSFCFYILNLCLQCYHAKRLHSSMLLSSFVFINNCHCCYYSGFLLLVAVCAELRPMQIILHLISTSILFVFSMRCVQIDNYGVLIGNLVYLHFNESVLMCIIRSSWLQ